MSIKLVVLYKNRLTRIIIYIMRITVKWSDVYTIPACRRHPAVLALMEGLLPDGDLTPL